MIFFFGHSDYLTNLNCNLKIDGFGEDSLRSDSCDQIFPPLKAFIEKAHDIQAKCMHQTFISVTCVGDYVHIPRKNLGGSSEYDR